MLIPSAQTLPTRRSRLREEWFAKPGVNVLSGLVVALALIPEAVSFSIIAGVDPKVGLYASFSISVIITFAGGRRGMISAATGAMALVLVPLVKDHGVEYLLATTILAGFVQVGLGALGVGRMMRFVPRTVMIGFVNSLAILIFLAQLPHIHRRQGRLRPPRRRTRDHYLVPRITKVVPAPLVAIVVVAGAAASRGLTVPTVGDMGQLPNALPVLGIPSVPFTLAMLGIIAPFAVTLAFVGLLESLLTAQLLDDITDTPSDKDRESGGQGIANIASVVIDLVDAHVWSSSAVATLDAVVAKFEARGISAEIVGLNEHSSKLHTRLTVHMASSH